MAPLARVCRRVVAVDLPGHGRAGLRLREEPAAVLELAEALAVVVQGLGEPAVLVGNSLGGALVLHTAAALPARVAGVVGVAGAPLSEADKTSIIDAFTGGSQGIGGALELLQRLYLHRPRVVWLFARAFSRHWGSRQVRHLVDSVRAAEAIPPEALRGLRCPALILWGEHDAILPASSVGYFRAHLGEAAVELVPRAGHLPQLERPRFVAERVARFIAALPAA